MNISTLSIILLSFFFCVLTMMMHSNERSVSSSSPFFVLANSTTETPTTTVTNDNNSSSTADLSSSAAPTTVTSLSLIPTTVSSFISVTSNSLPSMDTSTTARPTAATVMTTSSTTTDPNNNNNTMTSTTTTAPPQQPNNDNNGGVTTTIAAALPDSAPFDGFSVTFTPNVNVTSAASTSGLTWAQQSALVTSQMALFLTTVPALNFEFNPITYQARLALAFRLDLSLRMNVPAADLAIESVTRGASGNQALRFKFRVSQVRGPQIEKMLAQIVREDADSSNNNQFATDWAESTNIVLQEMANLMLNISVPVQTAGIDAVSVTGVRVTQAAPDGSFVTQAPPPQASPPNSACFVSKGDCAGTVIVCISLALFLIVVTVSVKIFWTYRESWIADARMKRKFEKEVENRNKLREKAMEGKRQMKEEDLHNTLRQEKFKEKIAQENEVREMQELKMEQIRAREYQQQQAVIQQQQQQQQQQHRNFNNGQGQAQYQQPSALQDGLLGTNDRAQLYQQQDRLAQTAPSRGRTDDFEYDDLL